MEELAKVTLWPILLPKEICTPYMPWWFRPSIYAACLVGVAIIAVVIWLLVGEHLWHHHFPWVRHPLKALLIFAGYILLGFVVDLIADMAEEAEFKEALEDGG